MVFRIGIDLGGTKTEIAALDGDGRIVKRERVPTPAGDYDATLHVLGGLVADMERALGATGVSVGVGTPGSASPVSGVMRNANSVCLNGRPFKQDFERVLGREVRIENDASCFALSEAVDGGGRGANLVFGVILGTGVGGGIVIGGHLLAWPERDRLRVGTQLAALAAGRGNAGSPVLWRAPRLHRNLSFRTGDGGRSRREDRGNIDCRGNRCPRPGRGPGLRDNTGALRGAAGARAGLRDQHHRSGCDRAGGGLSNVKRWYETVPSLWGPYVFSDVIRTRLVPNVHGDSSGVRGAAWLWKPADRALT